MSYINIAVYDNLHLLALGACHVPPPISES